MPVVQPPHRIPTRLPLLHLLYQFAIDVLTRTSVLLHLAFTFHILATPYLQHSLTTANRCCLELTSHCYQTIPSCHLHHVLESTMAPKSSAGSQLSPRDMEVLAKAWHCFETEPSVSKHHDYDDRSSLPCYPSMYIICILCYPNMMMTEPMMATNQTIVDQLSEACRCCRFQECPVGPGLLPSHQKEAHEQRCRCLG